MVKTKSKLTSFFSALLGEDRFPLEDLVTPLPEAMEELERRLKDRELLKRVENYLQGDIPEHFQQPPILYLARHVATPNLETLRFLHLVEPLGLKTVIGQDLKDRFVSQNVLKKSLCKMRISKGIESGQGGFFENFETVHIADINECNGKQLSEVRTNWGQPLPSFHKELFSKLTRIPVNIVDDSPWIDRHGRGDIVAHYKDFLALFVTHGILFEDYLLDNAQEERFVNEVLRPAFIHVKETFGVQPLIARLNPTTVESDRYWLSYPAPTLEILKRHLGDPEERGILNV